MKQLSFEDIEPKIEILNYNWLKGNPENLKIFFREKLKDKNLKPYLKKDCLKRLKELGE